MSRERGTVTIWALGDERHRVRAEGDLNVDRVIVGHDEARDLAHGLAGRLGESTYGAGELR
jgi:hypothetical protein